MNYGVTEHHGGTIKEYKNHKLRAQGASIATRVACTAYGTGAAWYFLARASTERDNGDRYSLSDDITNELDYYLAITALSQGLYATCPKDQNRYMIAKERYDESNLDTILAKTTFKVPLYIRAILAKTPMIAPSRSTLGVGQLFGGTRDVTFQANFYPKNTLEAEARALVHIERPPNHPLPDIKPDDEEVLNGIVEMLVGLSSPMGTNLKTMAERVKGNAEHLAKLVETYMHLRINGHQPFGASSLIRVGRPYNDDMRQSPREEKNKSRLENLMRVMGTQREALMNLSLSEWIQTNGSVVKDLCTEITKVTTSIQRDFASANDDKMELDEPVEKPYDKLAYDVSLTLNQVKISTTFETNQDAYAIYGSPGHVNGLSPVAVLASALENSPIMRRAGKKRSKELKHLPFAIVLSVAQAVTRCLFKDGFVESPYIFFDSHGYDLASFTEYTTIASLNHLGMFDGVIVEIFVTQQDLDLIKTVGGDYYAQHFSVPLPKGEVLHRFGDDLLPVKK